MRWGLLLLVGMLAWPGAVRAQSSLTGVVEDSLTHAPLAFASVFLANTTIGVTTTEQGTFAFPNLPPGSYEVVASYVGYRLAKQAVVVGKGPLRLVLGLSPTANRLGEVVVRPNPNRPSDYRKFVELFLGQSTFSRQCRIRNPDAVLVDFDPDESVLTATTPNFVEVENQTLGYRIKYYGLRFSCNFKQHLLTFYGEPVFEELTSSSKSRMRTWEENRSKAYLGSLTHFLKSVYDNRVAANGFLVQRLRVVPNPKKALIDSLRRQLVRQRYLKELSPPQLDSLNTWREVPTHFSMLYTAARPIDSLRRLSADGSRVFLRFADYSQVSYLRAGPDPRYLELQRQLGPRRQLPADRQVSQLLLREPEIEIQPNGQLANPLAVFTDEYWGFEKMGEFLPVNYLPPAPAASPSSPTR
ncbi:carboxypeptidase-like regulatory domain-containing protein [Hymenobacter sp. BT523]|uniref:carboxypeptidase-like regulatory domain-containing protein n=1 Tax=Hymenobacter sp. BT523 TaxID=2795725 RepID=UPI0018ED4E65|nr:carboxypeptidase-like regulatory domain-containing protein [Hymenobacter sp. BT523]MBJ6110183.1 carboxypeptidase-like regulatory domain-containing protein [Hymenobacter sp. BT523]